MSEPKFFDVVIFKIETSEVDAVVGKNLRRNDGYYNAEKRVQTVVPRLNENYSVKVVPAGKYKRGDTLKEEDK